MTARRITLAISTLTVAVILGLAGASLVAGAAEVTPGTDLLSATVTGPGLAKPVALTNEAGTNIAKSWVASATFSKVGQQPPADARVYTVHLVLSSATGIHTVPLRYKTDGTRSWFAAGDALKAHKYISVPIAAAEAMQSVLPKGAVPAPPASSGDDGGVPVAGLIGIVLVVGAIAAAIVLWVRRRRHPVGEPA